ncbi:hypothetical protein AG1IA_07580 [Rhizoctonia solani AG-1 IA]|uniref:Uncharacterized protein n=1 Tax=Thanatephorus cucumeris (strain AG1-IA) TaxID=983506 RepID=L8WJN3_THACA|nr:hypothetical protein AG1IA_07580 [Rhizoctonia solani AG-1 IA]
MHNLWSSTAIGTLKPVVAMFDCFKEGKAKETNLEHGAVRVELPALDVEAQRSQECMTCSDFNSPKGGINMVINNSPCVVHYPGRQGLLDLSEPNEATETGLLFPGIKVPNMEDAKGQELGFIPSGSNIWSTQNARFKALVRQGHASVVFGVLDRCSSPN